MFTLSYNDIQFAAHSFTALILTLEVKAEQKEKEDFTLRKTEAALLSSC